MENGMMDSSVFLSCFYLFCICIYCHALMVILLTFDTMIGWNEFVACIWILFCSVIIHGFDEVPSSVSCIMLGMENGMMDW